MTKIPKKNQFRGENDEVWLMISAYGHMVPLTVNYGQEHHSCREPILGQSYPSQSRWEGKTERVRGDGGGREMEKGRGEKGQGVNVRGEGGLGMGKEDGQREKGEVHLCSHFPQLGHTF